jgi:Protein of unknown function (DUF3800)
MLVFLDESGDAGFKFDRGSSTHFVIALVIFDDPLDAEETALAIKRLRQQLRKHEKFEFKFNKTDEYLRLQFLEAVRDYKFRVRVMLVDKRKLYSDALKGSKDKFYSYFVGQVLAHNHGQITGAKLRVDGSGDREFKKAFTTYLRQKLGANVLAHCRFVDSKADNLIQLADMIAGSVFRANHTVNADASFYERIRHKVEDLWRFG